MPKITSIIKIASVSLALAALSACANGNGDAAPGVDAEGHHPSDWVVQHAAAYKEANGGSAQTTNTTSCSQCHGALLDGGVANVSCFTAQWNGISCHPNADKKLGHPTGWLDKTSGNFHGFSTFNGQPVAGSATLGTACGPCHSVAGTASGPADAPSCLTSSDNFLRYGMMCHVTSPAAAGSSSNCVSCHTNKNAGGSLTGPDGATNNITGRPNRPGAHLVHLGFTGVTCATCHSGYGSGTAKHATAPSDGIAFLKLAGNAAAQNGSFGYSQGTCVGAICHGGKTTPAWTASYADITTACTSCHSFKGTAAAQYNDYFSGNVQSANLHQLHLALPNPLPGKNNAAIFCTDCHNLLTTVAGVNQHFGTLTTPGFEVSARSTLNAGGGGAISSYVPSDVTNLFNCTNSCHATLLSQDPNSRAVNPAPWPTN
ncbi:CxxxxCH/CxxCH domain c-type cytochrome [Geomesophilobacter sediminis]|uniref:CxxxxCH/CxxCH domain-containing protein n=1 Tax=Geomesophilobacter sediminis TaxID=2798584 RepID=A0A8J7M3B8_9BACT|nr:CxxxxCH/CxxCH domain-containing protein [Geomesophilobacter sediminis]MBJ6727933.1 CxxxxCH/CxxCH domain-containing protein [Geomesophilobacter sediminis]